MQADSSPRFISWFDLSLTRLQTNVKSCIESLGCFSLSRIGHAVRHQIRLPGCRYVVTQCA
jgi:hypothetical protein